MMPWKAAAILAMLLGGACSAQAAQLVTDSSFENIALGPIGPDVTSGGWIFNPYSADSGDSVGGVSSPVHSGSQAAYFTAYNETDIDISQLINFSSALNGMPAVLTFWVENGNSNNQLTVTLGTQSQFYSSLATGGYMEYTVNFTLGTSPQTLLFDFNGGDGESPTTLYLDDVSLNAPEPASMALLGAGLLGLGLLRRRKAG